MIHCILMCEKGFYWAWLNFCQTYEENDMRLPGLQDCGLQLNDEEGHRCYPLEGHLLCHRCHLHRLKTPLPPHPPPSYPLHVTELWTHGLALKKRAVERQARGDRDREVSVLPLNDKQGNQSAYFHLFRVYMTNQGGFYYYFHPSSPSSSHVPLSFAVSRGFGSVRDPARGLQHCRRGTEGDPCLFFLQTWPLNARRQHWTHIQTEIMTSCAFIENPAWIRPSPHSLPLTCTIPVRVCRAAFCAELPGCSKGHFTKNESLIRTHVVPNRYGRQKKTFIKMPFSAKTLLAKPLFFMPWLILRIWDFVSIKCFYSD